MHTLLRRAFRKARHVLSPPPEPWPSPSVHDVFTNCDWRLLVPEEKVPTPETSSMKLDKYSEYLQHPSYTAPRLQTALLPDVTYCATNNVVIVENSKVLAETTGPGARSANIDWRTLEAKRPTMKIRGRATALRCPFNNHYHLLVDNIPRLLQLHHPYFRSQSPIKLLCPGGCTSKESYLLDRILPPYVDIHPVPEETFCRVEQYIFLPFATKKASGYLHGQIAKKYRDMLGILNEPSNKSDKGSSPPLRLYLSRRNANTRHISNERELIHGLQKRGFQICMPEMMTLPQQIELFKQADFVVGPHGAGLANILFSTEVNVLELFGSRSVTTHYYLLAKSLDHSYRYISFDSSKDINNSFKVDPRHFFQCIDKMKRKL